MASRSRQVLFSAVSLSVITIFTLMFWLDRNTPFRQKSQPLDITPTNENAQSEKATSLLLSLPTITKSTTTPPLTSATRLPTFLKTPTVSFTMATPASSTGVDAPTVKLPQGTYVGTVMPPAAKLPRPVEVWRGIPYAQSTAGQNRFRAPVPLKSSTQSFAATAFGDYCPSESSNSLAKESEDCLNLNVYRPQSVGKKKKELLPVAIYVHGGGFNTGLGIERDMGSFVAFAEDDIIGVNFNYRVGALGFLPSEITTREGILNLGLRDQQALFEWVRENIEAFGGDQGNVTVMGLSAGAHSIGHHLMYYTKDNAPFHKAILESGAATARAVFVPTHPRHLIQFREFTIAAGIGSIPESEIMAKLRTLPLATILRASRSVWQKYTASVTWPFQPVIDGHAFSNSSSGTNSTTKPLIPDLPLRSWQTGHHLSIPILTGFNTNEGSIFVPPSASTDAHFTSFFRNLIPTLPAHDLDSLTALYPPPPAHYPPPPPGHTPQWPRLETAYAHYAYICPVLQTAAFLAPRAPVYVYQFAPLSGPTATANHGDNMHVVDHSPSHLAQHAGLARVADAMHGAWARFVASREGDPNRGGAGAVRWEPFLRGEGDGNKGRVMVFGEGNDERMGAAGRRRAGTPARMRELTEAEVAECKFWWERVELSQGLGRRRGVRAKL